MTISKKAWARYIDALRKVNDASTEKILYYIQEFGMPTTQAALDDLIDAAFVIANEYGEAAAALAAEFYDASAALSGVLVSPALPAPGPLIEDVAKAVVGTVKTGNAEIVSAAIGRLVKLQGVDTTMRNALRDGAEWAWIPSGDTCAFCITLASRGWQRASKKALKNGHAEHVHANCDCTYAVRFDSASEVAGYNNGADARAIYENVDLDGEADTPDNRINAIRRRLYAENREEIRAQQASAYEKRKELESSAAEEAKL